MTLLDSMRDPCVMMDKRTVSDGMGGFTTVWTEGAAFDATIIKNNSNEAVVGQQQGMNELFTVVVDKTISLDYHDVFKRVSDGQTFRLTSSTLDSAAPERSTIPIAKATCERWALT